jgi:hypothetical protein
VYPFKVSVSNNGGCRSARGLASTLRRALEYLEFICTSLIFFHFAVVNRANVNNIQCAVRKWKSESVCLDLIAIV